MTNDDSILTNVNQFAEEMDGDCHRFRSWEYCHKAFVDGFNKCKESDLSEKEKDELSLQLAFYLASWGMYRGSSFLLEFDYTIHRDIVEEILKKEYELLWNFDPMKHDPKMAAKLLFGEEKGRKKGGIYRQIRAKYEQYTQKLTEHKKVTDTLITKILLGTFGCIPAFDRYLRDGIYYLKTSENADDELWNDMAQTPGEKAFNAMCKFAQKNIDEINGLREKTTLAGYPVMKILDMYFWELGQAHPRNNNKKESDNDNE